MAEKRNADAIESFRLAPSILRAAGWDFADAWNACLPAPRGDRQRMAREALIATREAWARAYAGQPAERGEVAVSILAPFLVDDAADATETSAIVVA